MKSLLTQDHTLSNGEILYTSMDKLLSKIMLKSTDIFFDLGSGRGKVVLQVFLKSPVKEACGIELIPALHQEAMEASLHIRQDNRKLTFICGNFFEFPLNTATVLFINSTCFSQDMLFILGKLINNLPNIHTVLSLRPLISLERLPFKKAIPIECSWDSALCYLYR